MKIEYCRKWVRLRKSPAMPMTREEAENRHKIREQYVALVSLEESTSYVVDLTRDWVSVLFLDKMLRVYLSYDFKEVEKGKLFLTKAIHIEHDRNTGDIATSITFCFDINGNIYMERRNHKTSVVEEREAMFDTKDNWEDYPEFGFYEGVCRENRNTMNDSVKE